ncbi:non-canonical purine NTP pyrophosphatase [Pedobacter psychrophilus]|uniref:dITP/XTP pyrophosphatase n=1 Tax=Pedobacter psychrophilus TaxID=1826909 RepID=A0A179DC86_9SPHI|nr:RdgB/HAM1 family non-canonical purine NTP pyrophosphatase [Pedobacter psychrophilus]OAQ38647.1 non-canonical purine NTP pyrophosphatase [Pedobacter psychrophilus]
MENKLVFATNNAHKLEEVQAKVGNIFKIVSLAEINCNEDIAETGLTLQENASIKSQYINKNYNLNCFADDTGLEIKALNNEPGVFSARYSGSRDFKHNMDLVLLKMRDITDRAARFRTVVSLIIDDKEILFEGIVNGKIRETPSGNDGFGYDPIFEPDGYDITFAEMSLEDKNRISHRGLAMEKLIGFLKGI